MIEKDIVGKVEGIYYKDREGIIRPIEKGYFKEHKGLIEDIRSHKENRQVSFFTVEGWDEIRSSGRIGLCTKKFHEDIRIRNLNSKGIRVGSLIKIGDAVFQITEIGKRCFTECPMVKEGISCPLSKEAMFATVIKGGSVRVGDSLMTMK